MMMSDSDVDDFDLGTSGLGGSDYDDDSGSDFGEAKKRKCGDSSSSSLPYSERRREAVRKCRERKRKRERELKERLDELVEENTHLTLVASLCNVPGLEQKDEEARQRFHEGRQELFQDLDDLMKKFDSGGGGTATSTSSSSSSSSSNQPPGAALGRKLQNIHTYMEEEYLARKRKFGVIVDRVTWLKEMELAESKNLMLALSKLFGNQLNPELRETLGLNAQQIEKLKKREDRIPRMMAEFDASMEILESVARRGRAYGLTLFQMLGDLKGILKPSQLARLFVFIINNPASGEILDGLWKRTLKEFDDEITRDIRQTHLRGDRLMLVRKFSITLLVDAIAMADPKQREKMLELCLHPEGVIIEASAKKEIRGRRLHVKYYNSVFQYYDNCPVTNPIGELLSFDVDEYDPCKYYATFQMTSNVRASPEQKVKYKLRVEASFRDSHVPEVMTDAFIQWEYVAYIEQLSQIMHGVSLLAQNL